MAIIQDIKEIKELIPEPDYRPFGQIETSVPFEIIKRRLLFAVTVSSITGKPINIFRLKFVLLRRSNKLFLMFTNFLKEVQYTDYISLEQEKDKCVTKDDWKFEKDDIGLFARSECYDKNIIYLIDNPSEMGKLREKLNNKRLSKEITVEVTVI